MPRGLPHDAVHRVQRRARHVPLLRQQVQLLAVDDRPAAAVLHAAAGDAQGRQLALAGQPLPGLHQGGPVDAGQRRRPLSAQQVAIIGLLLTTAVPAASGSVVGSRRCRLVVVLLVPGAGSAAMSSVGGRLSRPLFAL